VTSVITDASLNDTDIDICQCVLSVFSRNVKTQRSKNPPVGHRTAGLDMTERFIMWAMKIYIGDVSTACYVS